MSVFELQLKKPKWADQVGQRIIRYPFPWKPFGIDLRGRSRVLKVNYRTTREIRGLADRLMEADAADADGVEENRRGTVSLLTGPKPEIRKFATPAEAFPANSSSTSGRDDARGVVPIAEYDLQALGFTIIGCWGCTWNNKRVYYAAKDIAVPFFVMILDIEMSF